MPNNPPATESSLTPTSAAEWGKKPVPAEEGFIVELPSGNVVRARRTLDLLVLLKAGRIPNPLSKIVQKMINERSANFPVQDMEDPVAVQQLMDLLDSTACKAVIEPKFEQPDPRDSNESEEAYQKRLAEWSPSEGAVSIFDVELQDKFYIFAISQGQAADLARFRQEQASDLALVQTGEGVQPAAKRTGRARPKSG